MEIALVVAAVIVLGVLAAVVFSAFNSVQTRRDREAREAAKYGTVTRTVVERPTSAPAPAGPAFETKRIQLWESGYLGTSHPDQKKLEKLLSEGWEIVNKERGTRRPWYTLRRAR